MNVRAKKDGKMETDQEFCIKDSIYEAYIFHSLPGDYYVRDELSKYRASRYLHGMGKNFFDKYFEII